MLYKTLNGFLLVSASCSCLPSCRRWRPRSTTSRRPTSRTGRSWSRPRTSSPGTSSSSRQWRPALTTPLSLCSWGDPRAVYEPAWVISCSLLRVLRHLIIENFIPSEEKNKILNRSYFDEDDEYWKMKPITRLEEWVPLTHSPPVSLQCFNDQSSGFPTLHLFRRSTVLHQLLTATQLLPLVPGLLSGHWVPMLSRCRNDVIQY